MAENASSLSRWGFRLLGFAVLCSLHGWLVVDTLRQKSPTVDEVAHLPAGRSFIVQGDYRLYHHNPPLPRFLAALAGHLPVDFTKPMAGPTKTYPNPFQWRPANHWLAAWDCQKLNDADDASRAAYLTAFTRARCVIAVWSILTIPVLVWWGKWWFGEMAGWLAGVLYCFCPNIIAHAGLVTTDLAATSTSLMACFAFARWLDCPGGLRAALAGAMLGAALLCKFSAVWLALLWPLWAALHPLLRHGNGAEVLERLPVWKVFTTTVGRQFLLLVACSWLVLNAGYRFQGRQVLEGNGAYHYDWGFTPFGEFGFVSNALTRERTERDGPPAPQDVTPDGPTQNSVRRARVNRFRGTILERVPCPLPYEFMAGLDDQMWESEGKYQTYLHGELRDGGGWRHYYLVALAIKTPLGTLLLVVGAFAGALWWQDQHFGRLLVVACLAATPIAIMTFVTDINLGLRYVLPSLPFLFLLGGAFLHVGRPAAWMVLAVPLVAWNLWSAKAIHPNEFAYFNELIGGPTNGRLWLIDSNVDWGQDLRSLSKWIAKHPAWKDARIAYWGSLPTRFEGLEVVAPPPRLRPQRMAEDTPAPLLPGEKDEDDETFGPQPGKYIVSVNFERGHRHHMPTPENCRAASKLIYPNGIFEDPQLLLVRVPQHAYSWFQDLTPAILPEIGYSFLLYDITLEEANKVRRDRGLKELPADWKAK